MTIPKALQNDRGDFVLERFWRRADWSAPERSSQKRTEKSVPAKIRTVTDFVTVTFRTVSFSKQCLNPNSVIFRTVFGLWHLWARCLARGPWPLWARPRQPSAPSAHWVLGARPRQPRRLHVPRTPSHASKYSSYTHIILRPDPYVHRFNYGLSPPLGASSPFLVLAHYTPFVPPMYTPLITTSII